MQNHKRIGVDIGGTTIKGALFEGEEIKKEETAPTNGRAGREAILSALYSVLDGLCEPGVPIGISSAGNIDPKMGQCVYATDNLSGWTGVPLAATVSGRYGVLCKADNDAVCALKGELKYWPELKNVTMLTFGTGVGGASLVNGEILRGKNFDAARWGHVTLVPGGRACTCGRKGCVEAYLSANALYLRGRRKIPGLESCRQLFEYYVAHDSEAEKLVRRFAGELDLLINNVRQVLSPELILLGGGLMQSWELIRPLLASDEGLSVARLGARAGIYGAASLVEN